MPVCVPDCVISMPQGQLEQALRKSLVPMINNEGLLT